MPNDPTSLSPQPLTEDEREHMNLLLTPQLRKIATGEHDASDAQRELARLLVAERERDSLARRCERYFRDLEQARTELSRLRAENTALAEQLAAGEASDGYHTHNELYDYRMLYNAHAALGWLAAGHTVVKSWKHSDGEPCFGGGWFVVAAELPTGQVTNHYEAKHWGLFNVPEELPPAYDGHTPVDAADRLRSALGLVQDGSA